MELYVGLTDFDWYLTLKNKNCDEVNFWRPGTLNFNALQPNNMFLFKLKKPYYAIVGGGFFVGYSLMPIELVWDAFAEKNGTKNKEEFYNRIIKYKQRNGIDEKKPYIGCIILTEPFFFEEDQWIKPMSDWSDSIVTGKKYSTRSGEGKRIYNEVLERLNKKNNVEVENRNVESRLLNYYEAIAKHRLGQGTFRIIVTDAYHRTCAITGEKTLPVLQAAHIKAFSEGGPNNVNNGLLLRSDFHILYDKGYITIDQDYTVNVSEKLKEDYGEGITYNEYHGKKIVALPDSEYARPSIEYLQWHKETVFMK